MFFNDPRVFLIPLLFPSVCAWIDYAATGYASMTHYGLPRDAIAACGCSGETTHYPTAALSQMAFGSSTAYGPGCGRCFNLTLVNTFLSDPPFFPPQPKSIVVKVTDLCPYFTGGAWCNATETKPNAAGNFLNFDLAFPSEAIPSDFFPSNISYYGYEDFGVWNVSYAVADCENWAGHSDQAALKAVDNVGPEAACCPANPTIVANSTCASYSDNNGIAPDKTQSFAHRLGVTSFLLILAMASVLLTGHCSW